MTHDDMMAVVMVVGLGVKAANGFVAPGSISHDTQTSHGKVHSRELRLACPIEPQRH